MTRIMISALVAALCAVNVLLPNTYAEEAIHVTLNDERIEGILHGNGISYQYWESDNRLLYSGIYFKREDLKEVGLID